MNTHNSPAIPLHQLMQQIVQVVNDAFASPLWVIAEISDLRTAANGHCYMQLIEKDAHKGTTLATVRAMVWANMWWMLSQDFAMQTGQPLGNGMKVMLQATVQMHAQYGLSLLISDFDPSYTLGEMARRRLEIIRQLEADGIIDMNRELPFPTRTQRIAVISASEAAGYGDFCNHLHGNAYGLCFYTHLVAATMQGQQTEASIMSALERIYELQDCFDVVVIIRGGGATVDLASFDSYVLATAIANFPLPVITGIGHDRDLSVLDRVAHTSVKTPTAAADLLIDTLAQQLRYLERLQDMLQEATHVRMEHECLRLQRHANAIRGTHTQLVQQIARLELTGQRIHLLVQQHLRREHDHLAMLQGVLPQVRQRILREQDRLGLIGQTIRMAQPDNILRRGFTITRYNGHAVKNALDVPDGATLNIQTAAGELKVKRVK